MLMLANNGTVAPKRDGRRMMAARKIILTVLFLVLAVPTLPDTADAGVLLRSQRVSSRVRTRPARITLGRATPSTAVAARMNPINSGGYNEPTVEYKRLLKERKYQQKLYQFRLKQARMAQRDKVKAARKQEQARKKAIKVAKKRQAQMKKQRVEQGQESGAQEQLAGSASGPDRLERNATERAVQGQKIDGEQPKKKLSFWSRFLRALFPGGKHRK